ncbi:cation:proton antiporter [Clostridium tetani]|uniref:Putative Na(+)/H(+) antiporter n=1 Tax=Clostridium tetani (strain Massachusetts / E88) TaxID=212717 RepID=Q892E2_CLOTE|nr:cation:proton antiporter [Clostridium tetani]AAO36653.1 putative Na(+)/H(+) antiporter [Clostridium tetani E88]AVP54058.1 potassium transporter [Clostridium tetani]KGI39339.1 potassium transporter [Clostridium tetani ATCC 9441]KGI41039.1 potassium transporter [Clostridium tetani]KGI45274.1 potassium transporter [Clostridium tetani]
MAVSLAIILLLGLLVSKLFEKIKLPGLLGMIILGTIIGPYGLNWLHGDMINVSADLRKIALIIILLRAGLGINKKDLKKVGKTAFKMSCVPGIIEGFSIAFVSVKLLEFSFIEGGMLGFIIAAVSPAVVVPSMLNLLESSIGTNKGIPTLILAGASIDDIFAITIFSTFLGLYSGANINIGIQLLNIPVSIILGIIAGGIIGFTMVRVFSKYHIRDTKKVLLILGTSILFTELEKVLKTKIEIASLLGVMTIGFVIIKKIPDVGKGLALKFNKIWIFAEILLFVLVGAEVNVNVAINAGKMGILVILIGLLGRSIGVIISLLGTDLNWKERLFCVIAYVPKATVQAAMGAVPLSLGVESGDIILAMAVLSIIITAPLGAIGINFSAKRLLYVDNKKE